MRNVWRRVLCVLIIGGLTWMCVQGQDTRGPQANVQNTVTITYEGGTAFVWEWKGSDLLGLVTYKPWEGVVTKQRWPIKEK